MKQKVYISRLLRKTNIVFTILIVILNTATFYFSDSNKNTFISFSIFFNCFLFFMYRLNLRNLINKNFLALKKETMYVNYPITIGVFFFLIFAIFCTDIYTLSKINKEALNITFIFTYFMSTISMLLPSILLLVYMYLVCPAFVIPSYEQKKKKSKTDIILFILFFLFLIFSSIQFIENTINALTVSTREKFKAIKMPVEYPIKHLKYTDLSEISEDLLSKQKLEIPFLYTAEGFNIHSYDEAEKFCKSLNAKVATHKEIYNIIFHRFDTYGEKYYWTSDKAGRNNLVLHFKNMSYEIIKAPEDVKPVLYCTADASPDSIMYNQKHFYRVKPIEVNGQMNVKGKKEITFPPQNIEKMRIDLTRKQTEETVSDDTAKHINFNVKHVDAEYFNELLAKGYNYQSHVKVNSYYEASESDLEASLDRDPEMKNMRLCYYPFIDYKNMSLANESKIWKNSFCSPSFDVLSLIPEQKTRYQKDAYCYSKGGRLPNIPELMGILKTINGIIPNEKYWTSNTVTDFSTNKEIPIAITVTNERFVTIEPMFSTENAYTYCIKKPQKTSKIISNFRSRFRGENGNNYAKRICPTCKYYEMPDTVLMQN